MTITADSDHHAPGSVAVLHSLLRPIYSKEYAMYLMYNRMYICSLLLITGIYINLYIVFI